MAILLAQTFSQHLANTAGVLASDVAFPRTDLGISSTDVTQTLTFKTTKPFPCDGFMSHPVPRAIFQRKGPMLPDLFLGLDVTKVININSLSIPTLSLGAQPVVLTEKRHQTLALQTFGSGQSRPSGLLEWSNGMDQPAPARLLQVSSPWRPRYFGNWHTPCGLQVRSRLGLVVDSEGARNSGRGREEGSTG